MCIQEAPVHPAAPRAPRHTHANGTPQPTGDSLSLGAARSSPHAEGFPTWAQSTWWPWEEGSPPPVVGGQDLFSGGSSQP